jgi:hypothetical protein
MRENIVPWIGTAFEAVAAEWGQCGEQRPLGSKGQTRGVLAQDAVGGLARDGQWVAGRLNPALPPTTGFLGQMIRSAGHSLEGAAKLLHQVAPVRCVEVNAL